MKILLFFISSLFFNSFSQASCPLSYSYLYQYFIDNRKIDFYSNYPLDQINSCIEHVIIAIHGTTRDAYSRFNDLRNTVKANNLESKTLIIAPYFKTDEDDLDFNDYYWSNDGWKKGNTSNTGHQDISSFSILDLLLESIISSNYFLFIKKVTLTGHSAGGQYTQLYALSSPIVEDFPFLSFSFLVLNPSNYSYLNAYRPHPNIINFFELPVYVSNNKLKMKDPYNSTAGDCPNSYNDYKYGFDEKNAYTSKYSNSDLRYRFLNRKVYYFLGALDTLQDNYLDKSCSAKIQGRHRLERGKNFYNFLNTYYSHQHELFIVDNVGHNAKDMYNSSTLKNILLVDQNK